MANGDSLANLFGATGFDWEQEFTPAQQFRNWATTQTRPGMMRDAFYGQELPLTQRYLLGLGGQRGAMTPGGTFGDYLGTYAAPQDPRQGYAPRTTQELRSLAEAANLLGGMTGGEYTQYAGTPGMYGGLGANYLMEARADPGSLREQIYRSQYGTAQGAEENRRNLAMMLALQRPDGAQGQYGGIIGQAITGAMTELYNNMMAQQGGGGNFLDWYLKRTRGGSTAPSAALAGWNAPVAPTSSVTPLGNTAAPAVASATQNAVLKAAAGGTPLATPVSALDDDQVGPLSYQQMQAMFA